MSSHANVRLLKGLFLLYLLSQAEVAQAQAAAAYAACSRSPACIGITVVGGIAYMVLSNGQHQRIQGGYLEDPEGDVEEWSDYTTADSDAQARARCQQMAIERGVVLVNVVKRGSRSRYECFFRTYRS